MEGEVSCLHCHSSNVKFKYLNNGKGDQHRYRCLECKEWFTWEDHKRPKPKHYKKVRNQDPVEIQGQRTQCTKCFAVNKARFMFYNNKKRYGETQPRFKCLNCGKFFQMHLKGGVLVALKSNETTMNNSGKNIEPGGACLHVQDGEEMLDCFARQIEADLEEETQSETTMNNSGDNIEPGGACLHEQDGEMSDCFAKQLEADLDNGTHESDIAMSLADQAGSNYSESGFYDFSAHGDYIEPCIEYDVASNNTGAYDQEADAMSLAALANTDIPEILFFPEMEEELADYLWSQIDV